MMNKLIQINKHIFKLKKFEDNDKILSCDFTVKGKESKEMTEDEFKTGHIYQQEIFDGKWNWLIFNRGIIKIPEFKIEITLSDPIYDGSLHWGGGNINGEMTEICPHHEDQRKEVFNRGINVIEWMVLTHATEGLNIESDMYKRGIRSALNNLTKNT